MPDVITQLQNELEDAIVTLEELNECGDLEDRLEAALHVSDLKDKLKIALKAKAGGNL